MKLSPGIKKEFEEILGGRHITDDPAKMSGYAWCTGVGKVPGEKKFAEIWPIAVVLPATTEEVAAVVKCCLRHGLDYKAHSTGYGSMSNVVTPKSVAIDLRRMNSLKIIPEDRMAIIGPYVTAGSLQAEALKHGMTCHIVGAGPAHSPLASATALIGVGITSQGTSANMRNLLSWEWVSPSGDIVRGGSAGSDCGWFSGEGPGPGARGMIRGFLGTGGALGVFTKIGYKLYPVPITGLGPVTGALPQLGNSLPENWDFFHAVWPDWESHTRASFELLEDDLCFAMLRMPTDHIGWTVTASNAEFVGKTRSGALPPVATQENDKSWTMITTAASAAEHNWRNSVVKDIIGRTGGKIIDLAPEERDVLFRNLFTSHHVPRVMRPSGGITTSFGVLDSFHFMPRAMDAAERVLGNHNKPGGKLVEGARDEHWAWPHESRYLWAENIINFNPADRQSREIAAQVLLQHFAEYWQDPVGVLAMGVGPVMDLQGDKIGEPQRYIRQVKHFFDPGNHSRSNEYVTPSLPKPVAKALPHLRWLLLSRPVRKLMAKVVAKKGL